MPTRESVPTEKKTSASAPLAFCTFKAPVLHHVRGAAHIRRILFRRDGAINFPTGLDFDKVIVAFKLIFGIISVEEFKSIC
jgi:hypothetical protein